LYSSLVFLQKSIQGLELDLEVAIFQVSTKLNT
jgi:hypothetical protein